MLSPSVPVPVPVVAVTVQVGIGRPMALWQRGDGGCSAVVMGLDELRPLSRRPTRGRHRRRLDRLADVRREVHYALCVRSRCLLIPPRFDPLTALVPRQRVEDALGLVAAAADYAEPFECKRGPGTVPHEMLQGLTGDTHLLPRARWS